MEIDISEMPKKSNVILRLPRRSYDSTDLAGLDRSTSIEHEVHEEQVHEVFNEQPTQEEVFNELPKERKLAEGVEAVYNEVRQDARPEVHSKPKVHIQWPDPSDEDYESKAKFTKKIERAINSKRFGHALEPYADINYQSFDLEDFKQTYAEIQLEIDTLITDAGFENKARSFLQGVETFAPAVGMNAKGLTNEMMSNESVLDSIEQYRIDTDPSYQGPMNRLLMTLATTLTSVHAKNSEVQAAELARKEAMLNAYERKLAEAEGTGVENKKKSSELSALRNELNGPD